MKVKSFIRYYRKRIQSYSRNGQQIKAHYRKVKRRVKSYQRRVVKTKALPQVGNRLKNKIQNVDKRLINKVKGKSKLFRELEKVFGYRNLPQQVSNKVKAVPKKLVTILTDDVKRFHNIPIGEKKNLTLEAQLENAVNLVISQFQETHISSDTLQENNFYQDYLPHDSESVKHYVEKELKPLFISKIKKIGLSEEAEEAAINRLVASLIEAIELIVF